MQEDRLSNLNGYSAEITVGNWLKLDCIKFLSIIPVIGTIAAIVIYIILAFKKDIAISIQSRIKADLIWMLIVLIASIIILVIVLIVAGSLPSVGVKT